MSTNDQENVDTVWDALYLRPSSVKNIPEVARAWTTIVLAIVLLSFLGCVVVICILLVRLGLSAVSLSGSDYQEPAKNFLLAFASVFGGPLLVWRTWVAHQQARAAQQQALVALENHITGIFSKSVELLGFVREIKTTDTEGKVTSKSAPNIESRLGALYALERLLRESQKDQRVILEILCAYVRENSPFQIPADDSLRDKFSHGDSAPTPTRRSDVQAAITVIGRRPAPVTLRAKNEDWRLDFRNTNLVGYDFSELNFDRSDFTGSFLNFANLRKASFANSVFENTTFCSAQMQGTCFESSTLRNCNVRRAEIDETDFSLATFDDTDLREARVTSFNIKGANLDKAFGTYLSFIIDDVKSKGTYHHVHATEIVETFELFKKATHDGKTSVSQAVRDAISLMSNQQAG